MSDCKRQALLVDQSIRASGQPNEVGCCVWTRHPIGRKSLSSGCQFSRVLYRSSTRFLGCRLANLGTPSQRSCSLSRRSDLRRLRHLHEDLVINLVDDVQVSTITTLAESLEVTVFGLIGFSTTPTYLV